MFLSPSLIDLYCRLKLSPPVFDPRFFLLCQVQFHSNSNRAHSISKSELAALLVLANNTACLYLLLTPQCRPFRVSTDLGSAGAFVPQLYYTGIVAAVRDSSELR